MKQQKQVDESEILKEAIFTTLVKEQIKNTLENLKNKPFNKEEIKEKIIEDLEKYGV